jgi:hypothetical protein
MHLVFDGWVFPSSLSYQRCISSPNLAKWSNITVAPRVISSRVANGNAPLSTYRKSMASQYVSFGSFFPVDKYCFGLWLLSIAFPLAKCSSDAQCKSIFLMLFLSYSLSNDSANAVISLPSNPPPFESFPPFY